MHPIEIIELWIVGVVIVSTVIIAVGSEGKLRKVAWVLTLVTFIGYGTFFVARPYWIDSQFEKEAGLIERYLEERYPDEKWTISRYDRRGGSPYSYRIEVTFKSETDIKYFYHVGSKDKIYQYGLRGGSPSDAWHWER